MQTIQQAVAPLREAAMTRAVEYAKTIIANVRLELDSVGWDADKAAPSPRNCPPFEYYIVRSKYLLFRQLTDPLNPVRFGGGPDIRKPSPQNEELFKEETRKTAADQFDAFVAKLEKKIGPVTDAAIQGTHVWGYSVLTVQTARGEERWKTKQITNISKLGKVFSQWPSRKINDNIQGLLE